MSDRAALEEQTQRNLDGLELEREGRTEEAVALYERNVAEGFEGDWPYGRLVAYYERQGRFDQAERVLTRAIEIFRTSKRRTPEDRRGTLAALRRRLRLVKRAGQQARTER